MSLVLTCSCLCPIHWSQVFSGEWRCSWSSADRRCSSYIWVTNNLIAYYSASYIRDLTVPTVGQLPGRGRVSLVYSNLAHCLNKRCFIDHQILDNKLPWSLNQTETIFIQENEFQYVVCKLGFILWWLKCDEIFLWAQILVYSNWITIETLCRPSRWHTINQLYPCMNRPLRKLRYCKNT